MIAGKNGVTSKTTKNILFGAGTIHRGLKHDGSKWNFKESIVGATSGGSKLSIVPEITPIEVDGVMVTTKGLQVKTGETATMEINFIELSAELIKATVLGETDEENALVGYEVLKSKGSIDEGDYWDNIAFVGRTLKGKNIIAIMDNALCTSGLELEGKSKEAGIPAMTFTCHAEITDDSDFDTLPWHIYYPNGVTGTANYTVSTYVGATKIVGLAEELTEEMAAKLTGGTATVTSGENTGSALIKKAAAGAGGEGYIQLETSLGFDPAEGDTVNIAY